MLFATGCSKAPERAFEIVAVVPFENLGPQPTAITGTAIAAIAAERTAGDRKTRVAFAPTVRDAQALRATRILSGWYSTRDGVTRVRGLLRDEVRGQSLKSFELSGTPDALPRLAEGVAAQTGAPVHDWPAPSAPALVAYFEAREANTPEAVLGKVNEALAADPSFGAAHLLRLELMMRSGARDQAIAAAEQAKQTRLSPADRARLDYNLAQLRNDPPAQAAALSKLVSIQTANGEALRTLLDLQLATREFRGAADTATRLLELAPDDEDALNRRGYSYALAGDLPSARKAFDEYRARLPQSANALDSLAEVLFYFRSYEEAANLFAEAGRKNPQLVGGFEPFRAALSLHLAGKGSEADRSITEFFAGRKAANNPRLAMEQAVWARYTGKSGVVFPPDAEGTVTAALIALLDGDRARAAELADKAKALARSPQEAGMVSVAVLLAQPSAPPATWKERLQRALTNPAQAGIRLELLGWALFLDRHYPEASSTWRERFDTTSPLANSDARILLTWSLVNAGRKEEARKVMPHGWFPPPGMQGGLAALLYPGVVEMRNKI